MTADRTPVPPTADDPGELERALDVTDEALEAHHDAYFCDRCGWWHSSTECDG